MHTLFNPSLWTIVSPPFSNNSPKSLDIFYNLHNRNGETIDSDTAGLAFESKVIFVVFVWVQFVALVVNTSVMTTSQLQANHHTVTVLSVEDASLGQYACHADNVYGSDSKTIQISGNTVGLFFIILILFSHYLQIIVFRSMDKKL